jgi:hypothetical protein
MPIAALAKISALFASVQPKDLDELTPAERVRFGQLCRHWAELAERGPREVAKKDGKVGVLDQLWATD